MNYTFAVTCMTRERLHIIQLQCFESFLVGRRISQKRKVFCVIKRTRTRVSLEEGENQAEYLRINQRKEPNLQNVARRIQKTN